MPRRKKDDPRDVNMTIRFSTAEITALQQRARIAGCTVAAYTRQAIFGAAIEAATVPPPSVTDELAARELAHQVRMVGVNLNQIARRMNEEHSPPPDLLVLLDEIRAYVRQAGQLTP